MNGDCTNSVFASLHALTWLLASFSGTWVCCRLSTLPHMGTVGLVVLLTAFSAAVVLSGSTRVPGRMTHLATASLLSVIALGTAGGLVVQHIP